MKFHVYLTIREKDGRCHEETEKVTTESAANALIEAAGRWEWHDDEGQPLRRITYYQVWLWDGYCETLQLANPGCIIL